MERRLAHAKPLQRLAHSRVERLIADAEPVRGRWPHAGVERKLAHTQCIADAEPVSDGRECGRGEWLGVGRGDAWAAGEYGVADAWKGEWGGRAVVVVAEFVGWVGKSWTACVLGYESCAAGDVVVGFGRMGMWFFAGMVRVET